MEDIFQAKILCNECNSETEKTVTIKDGFKLRSITCKNCKKTWPHPSDLKQYNKFKDIKNKNYKVKLRVVGNSYTVSIPKEIINFEEKFKNREQDLDKIINLNLEKPGKITLFFSRIYRK